MPSSRAKTSLPLVLGLLTGVAGAAGFTAYYYQQVQDRNTTAAALTGGDPIRGEAALLRYGCAGCHSIAGVRGPRGQVGPPLEGVARRVYLGGVITNTPENMIAWIVDPRAIDPKTAMPATGISRREARDVAAYLYSH